MTRTFFTWILVAVAGLPAEIVVMSQGLNGFGGRSPVQADAESAAAIPVEVAPVLIESLHETATAVGTLEANEAIMIRPEIAGIVTRVRFVDGQAVTQGAVLIKLDDAELQGRGAQPRNNIVRLTYYGCIPSWSSLAIMTPIAGLSGTGQSGADT